MLLPEQRWNELIQIAEDQLLRAREPRSTRLRVAIDTFKDCRDEQYSRALPGIAGNKEK